MHTLQTAIIQHTTADGVHYDWLIEDPRLPGPHVPSARLWAARVPAAPCQWPAIRRCVIEVIPPHRRAYLSYQGGVSGGRGRVLRVLHGHCVSKLWTDGRIVLSVDHRSGRLEVELRRLGANQWHMTAGGSRSTGMNDSSRDWARR